MRTITNYYKYEICTSHDDKQLHIMYNGDKDYMVNYEISDLGVSCLATDLTSWLKEEKKLNKAKQTMKQLEQEIVDKIGLAFNRTFQFIDVDNYAYDGLED